MKLLEKKKKERKPQKRIYNVNFGEINNLTAFFLILEGSDSEFDVSFFVQCSLRLTKNNKNCFPNWMKGGKQWPVQCLALPEFWF